MVLQFSRSLPVIRFEYLFDLEVLDDELREEFAKPGSHDDAGDAIRLMNQIRVCLETALAEIPGVRLGVGLSGLHSCGPSDLAQATAD